MVELVPIEDETPSQPAVNGKSSEQSQVIEETHLHEQYPPRGPVEKREFECIQPQPEATLKLLQEPLPFPPTLVETLTYIATYTDQAGYLAKHSTERFEKLDQAYHVLKTDTEAEITKLKDTQQANEALIEDLKGGLAQKGTALEDKIKEHEELQRVLEGERAISRENDTTHQKAVEELQLNLKQKTDDHSTSQRDLEASSGREKALQDVVRNLEEKVASLTERAETGDKRNADLENEKASLQNQVAEVQKDFASSQDAVKNLEGKVEQLTARVETEEKQNAELEKEKASLQNQITDFQKDLANTQEALNRKTKEHEDTHRKSTEKDGIIEGLESGLLATTADRDRHKADVVELKNRLNPPKLVARNKNFLTAVPRPRFENQMYFFKLDKDVRIDAVADSITRQASPIKTWWDGLRIIGWDSVDAFVPITGTTQAYAFRKDTYIKYDISTDRVIDKPATWASKWPALAKAGLTQIDTALPIINDGAKDVETTWFFQNNQAICIDIANGGVLVPIDDIVIHFPSLAGAEVESVDVAVFKPGKAGREAYFFVGDRVFLVDLVRNVRLFPAANVRQEWKCLRDAGFY